jgi:hypothetical protein
VGFEKESAEEIKLRLEKKKEEEEKKKEADRKKAIAEKEAQFRRDFYEEEAINAKISEEQRQKEDEEINKILDKLVTIKLCWGGIATLQVSFSLLLQCFLAPRHQISHHDLREDAVWSAPEPRYLCEYTEYAGRDPQDSRADLSRRDGKFPHDKDHLSDDEVVYFELGQDF